ncbi:cytochrome P450 [Hysterangium stoloniferum]|nr:cytochrome P450 [Hysterangium stoloniferum]
MRRSRVYEEYTQWKKTYGDIVHIEVLGKHIIFINSVDVANDLLAQRSAIYSDRPYLPMVHDADLMDLDWAVPMKQYSPSWKRYRRLLVHHINSQAVKASYSLRQVSSTHTLLRSILRSPTELDTSIQHTIGNVLLGMVYGFDVQLEDDPHVEITEQFTTGVMLGVNPGRFLVNVIPWLRYAPSWVPGNKFKAHTKEVREVSEKLIRVPFESYNRQLAAGNASACFIGDALGDLDEMANPEVLDEIKKTAASMYAAGAETSVLPLKFCILALILHPQVQHRAHKELDTVLGSPDNNSFRLPSFEDRPHLPYIDALVKESLRWIPAAAMGFPHATSEENVYRGCRIPRGSIVLANSWAMLHDETVYPDPFSFRPERFLASVDKAPEVDPLTQGVFGFGRRVCPGQEIAYTLLWIEIASLLAVFDFAPAKDSEGRDIDVSYAAVPEGAMLLQPPAYPRSITPRSQYTKARILETEYQ